MRPSEEKIKEHLPDLFQGKYEIVQGILDCTELKCEPSKGFQKHSEIYSDYKSHDTFKGPDCISPSGWITIASHLYLGRISNKDNCREKQFCQLIETADQHHADKSCEIHDQRALRGWSQYLPSKRFSAATDQFTENLCFEAMSIANVHVHVHVERAIKQITTWHVFKQVLPRLTYGSVNQIWNVCALLINVQNPIISV